MIQDEITVERIRVKDLYAFSSRSSAHATGSGIQPLARHRALACANNPYAADEDLGLLLAYCRGRCVGYLGIMPGLLKGSDGLSRVHWLSTWYVDPEFRNTSVGSILLLHALALPYDLVVSNMSAQAEAVYRRLGFQEVGPLDYYLLHVEILNVLSLALRAFRKGLATLRIQCAIPAVLARAAANMYRPIRSAIYALMLRSLRGPAARLLAEQVPALTESDGSSLQDQASTEFYRGIDAINWMLRFRWTTESHQTDEKDARYFFAEMRDVFKYIPLRLRSSNDRDLHGFVVLSFSVQKNVSILKVLDFCIPDPDDYDCATAICVAYARTLQATQVEFPKEFVPAIRNTLVGKLLLRRHRRVYLCRPRTQMSPLAIAIKDLHLKYCDGDTPFT